MPRENLFHAASDGALAPVDTYLPPQHPMYAPVDPIRYDPVRAAALLEDAGFFVPAQGGPRARADGTVLRFTIDAGNEKEETEELLQGIRSALAAVGIELEPRLRPFKELSDSLASGRTQRQLTFYSWASMPSVLGTGLFRADRIPTAENDFVGANTTGYRNDDVTALLKRVDESTDEAERKAAIAAALRLLRRDLPVLPLYVRAATVVVRKGVKNLRPTGTVTPLAWNAARWDVDVRAP